MRKKEAEGMGLVLAIILVPFFWLYDRLGWWGIVGLVGCVIALIVWYQQHKQKKYEEWRIQSTQDFSELVLEMLHSGAQHFGGLSMDEMQEMQHVLYKNHPDRGMFFRCVTIFCDSVWLVKNGRKRDTIEGRMDSVNRVYENMDFNEVTHEVASEIAKIRQNTYNIYQVTRFKNEAAAHAEKALTMKTSAAQRKYMDLAMGLLVEGVETYPENEELRTTLSHFKDAYLAAQMAVEQQKKEKQRARKEK